MFSGFIEEQIIKEQERVVPTATACCRLGISIASLQKKAKYGFIIDVSDALSSAPSSPSTF